VVVQAHRLAHREVPVIQLAIEWVTPNGDELVAKMARVSNPNNENNNETAPRLIRYLISHKHWSPFEMVNACVQIEVPRDIGRQILRHRSFSFQEFSGRYAAYEDLYEEREGRLQDTKNRQNSLPLNGDAIKERAWRLLVQGVRTVCLEAYRTALDMGIAKEVARALLPEGLIPSRMYVNGTLRSWIHYFQVRCDPATQKEHRELAEGLRDLILAEYPMIKEALNAP
jgi:thymidylate synthase (FAD)